MSFFTFESIRKNVFAVLVEDSRVAEVTMSKAHCAVTPTTSRGIPPDLRSGIEVFMQMHENCDHRRKCQRCPRLVC